MSKETGHRFNLRQLFQFQTNLIRIFKLKLAVPVHFDVVPDIFAKNSSFGCTYWANAVYSIMDVLELVRSSVSHVAAFFFINLQRCSDVSTDKNSSIVKKAKIEVFIYIFYSCLDVRTKIFRYNIINKKILRSNKFNNQF